MQTSLYTHHHSDPLPVSARFYTGLRTTDMFAFRRYPRNAALESARREGSGVVALVDRLDEDRNEVGIAFAWPSGTVVTCCGRMARTATGRVLQTNDDRLAAHLFDDQRSSATRTSAANLVEKTTSRLRDLAGLADNRGIIDRIETEGPSGEHHSIEWSIGGMGCIDHSDDDAEVSRRLGVPFDCDSLGENLRRLVPPLGNLIVPGTAERDVAVEVGVGKIRSGVPYAVCGWGLDRNRLAVWETWAGAWGHDASTATFWWNETEGQITPSDGVTLARHSVDPAAFRNGWTAAYIQALEAGMNSVSPETFDRYLRSWIGAVNQVTRADMEWAARGFTPNERAAWTQAIGDSWEEAVAWRSEGMNWTEAAVWKPLLPPDRVRMYRIRGITPERIRRAMESGERSSPLAIALSEDPVQPS